MNNIKRPMMMMEPPMEYSIYPKYKCGHCGEKLWTMKGPKTNYQEWLRTKDGRRHFKNRCNLREASHE